MRKTIIDNNYQKIFFVHIKKTAGTSINATFINFDRTNYNSENWNENGRYLKFINNDTITVDNKILTSSKFKIKKADYFYATSHEPFYKYKFSKNTFTFTCFRDTFKRWLSFYKECFKYKKNNAKHPIRNKTDRLLGKSFFEFTTNCKKNLKSDLLNQIYMFSPNYNIKDALKNINKLSYYFFVEDFNNGIKFLSENLNLPLKSIHVRKNDFDVEYTKEEKNEIMDMLKLEYQLLDQLKNGVL